MKKTALFISTAITTLLMTLALVCGRGSVDGRVRIDSVKVQGTTILIEVPAENTGKGKHEFPIGCSLQRADGTWYDVPFQMHKLEQGEQKTIRFSITEVDTAKFVLVRVAIWNKVMPNGLLDTRYDMDEKSIRR